MNPFLKIDLAAPLRFSADLPWSAPQPSRTLSDSLQASGPRLQANHSAAAAPVFKANAQASTPVNNAWKQTPIGNGKIISMAGPNSDAQGRPVIPGAEAVPNWKNAFETEPVSFGNFAHGYFSEMVLGNIDLAKTLLTHVKNTALEMARQGQIPLGIPTPQKLLQDGGAVLVKAFGEPLAAAVADAAAHPDRTLNNSGDAVAQFSTDYADHLSNPYQTANTSFAAGAGTYLLMTMGGKNLLEKLLPDAAYAKSKVNALMDTTKIDAKFLPDDDYAKAKILQLTDSKNFEARHASNLLNVIRNTAPATVESIQKDIRISRIFGNDRITYTYSPSLAPQAENRYQPMYANTPKGFSEHGIKATYNPNNKTLLVHVNTEKSEGATGLNHALGDSGLMTSAVMEVLKSELRSVHTIVLRPNVLQGSKTSADLLQLKGKELAQLNAIQALEKEGFVFNKYVGASPSEVGLVFHKKP